MELRDRLNEVEAKGAPAQATRAAELLAQLTRHPDDQSALDEADALIDAYLHDPYLTKNEGD